MIYSLLSPPGNQPVSFTTERCTQKPSIPKRLFGQGNLVYWNRLCYLYLNATILSPVILKPKEKYSSHILVIK